MITKNWYSVFAASFMGARSTDYEYVDCSGTTRQTNGSASNMTGLSFDNVGNINTNTSPSSSGITFGTGTVTPTANDYWLSGNVVSTLSLLSQTSDKVVSGSKWTQKKIFVVKNTGSSAVTITEVCWHGTVGWQVMFDRTLLDSPVTIPAGGQGVVTYTVALDLPIPS